MEDIHADTNILLRSAEPAHPTHQKAVNAVRDFLTNGDRVCLIPQNLIEFWNVATRPVAKNGFGWTPAKTDVEITRLESLLTVLPDRQAIYREWRKLVLVNSVLGKQVHDARIVAAMSSRFQFVASRNNPKKQKSLPILHLLRGSKLPAS